MPEFGDVVINLTDLIVAPLLANGTYGGYAQVVYHSKLSFEGVADNDILKSGGLVVEALTVPTHYEGEIEQGAVDATGLYVMTGTTTDSSGSTPNRVATTDFLLGGNGLPYFGVIGMYAGLNGSNALIGLRKVLLDKLPGWVMDEQNRFRISNVAFKAFAINATTRKATRWRRYETANISVTDFNAFFA